MATRGADVGDYKPKWGDQDEDFEDYEKELGHAITKEEPQADGSILRTVTEYVTNEKGQKVKLVKKIRLYKKQIKINRKVLERRKWRKFGECAGVVGPEKGITAIGDEVFLDVVHKGEAPEKVNKLAKEAVNLGIVCRNCGKTGDHWTLKCPYFKDGRSTFTPESEKTTSSETSGKYVAPKRTGTSTGPAAAVGGDRDRGREEVATIRVTNLSEDTKETDLAELFRNFGPISRIYLAKDKITGLSKGFAFINFVYREHAAKAIEKLSGYGYDHLILHLEWAKPSNK